MSPSRFLVNRNQREKKKKRGREIKGTTTDSPSLLTPTHLLSHWPTQLSSHSGVRRSSSQQLSCLVPLIHFNTQWWTHQTPRATQDPYPSLHAFQRKRWRHENMKMLFTGVCEGGNFHHAHVYFLCRGKITHFSDVPPHRAAATLLLLKLTERGEQIGEVLNYWGGWHFFKLFIWFTPLGYVIIATANPWIGLLAYSYILSYLFT